MKKILIIILGIALVLMGSAYIFIPNYATSLVKDYDPYTFERVLEDDTMRVHYGIYEKESPADYGFEFTEINLTSIQDGNQLNGWFIPASKPSTKTLIIIHGRWSNRLKTMKYLDIIKQYAIDSMYNVMIPDLRNSGKSEWAQTMMGYEFAEDITTNIKWLAEEQSQEEVVLFGFSMGGMAVPTVINRPDLVALIDGYGVKISKLILDSPVANVEKILMIGGKNTGLPEFLVSRTLDLLDEEYEGYPRKMSFRNFLSDQNIPILVLQGTNDISQPIEILEEELEVLDKPNIQYEVFEGGEHVRLYQVDDFKPRYAALINKFLRQ